MKRGKPDPVLKPFRVSTSDDFTGTRGLLLAPDARSVYASARGEKGGEKEWGFDEIPLTFPFKRPQPQKWRNLARWPFEPGSENSIGLDLGGWAFNESGTVLMIAANRQTFVIDTASGKELGRLEGHAYTPDCVAVSADGTRIATADLYGLVRLWDAKTLRPLHDAPISPRRSNTRNCRPTASGC